MHSGAQRRTDAAHEQLPSKLPLPLPCTSTHPPPALLRGSQSQVGQLPLRGVVLRQKGRTGLDGPRGNKSGRMATSPMVPCPRQPSSAGCGRKRAQESVRRGLQEDHGVAGNREPTLCVLSMPWSRATRKGVYPCIYQRTVSSYGNALPKGQHQQKAMRKGRGDLGTIPPGSSGLGHPGRTAQGKLTSVPMPCSTVPGESTKLVRLFLGHFSLSTPNAEK